ncbi:MAG: hypothetical protein IJU50_07890 [Lachnospiraceae bacterium]|nr:hypothetical protein [Lachnospiraceae bacterium]
MALARDSQEGGIGTLSEKTVHAALKEYFCPDQSMHEVPVRGYVADIFTGEEIIEIQTRHFDKLKGKLSAFLPAYPVTIVYPVSMEKRLYWINEDTGECREGRVSPLKGKPHQVFGELYRIRSYLSHPNLKLAICLLNVREYRTLKSRKNGKKRTSKLDRVPESLEGIYRLERNEDYRLFLPDTLPEMFTSSEYAKACHISLDSARYTLLLLSDLQTVHRVGKQGHSILYSVC